MEKGGKERIGGATAAPPKPHAGLQRGLSDREVSSKDGSARGGPKLRPPKKAQGDFRGKGKEEGAAAPPEIPRLTADLLDRNANMLGQPVGGNDGSMSARSAFSVRTAIVEQHSQSQPQDAGSLKAALKAFVAELVRGRELQLQPRGGGSRPTRCRLSPDVTGLLVGEEPSEQRMLLRDMLHIHRGFEAVPLDLGIPLDAHTVVLELANSQCLTFQLGQARAADDFVLFMRLLTAMQRQQQQQQLKSSQAASNNDDARSEISVQTGLCQKTLNSTPVSAVANDPKEVKKMFKMFTETMRRGRDFYVVKADGGLQDVECALSKGNDEFRMRWENQKRILPLCEMMHIRTHQEVEKLKLGFPVDERCATVELQTGECITYKFGHIEACERFILCMKILVDQKRPHFASRGFGGSGAAPAGAPGGKRRGDTAPASPPLRKSNSSASISSKQSRLQSETGGAGGGVDTDTRAAVEAFVKQMVAGCDLNVVGPAGLMQVHCMMGSDLKAIAITAHDGSTRQLELAAVKAVHVGAEVLQLGLDGVAADEMCGTVEMATGDCLTFRFAKADERDRFAACVRIFAAAHQQ